jgi:hypothetical protein
MDGDGPAPSGFSLALKDARPGDAMQSADLTMPRDSVIAFCARQSGDLDAS